jgi:hypothetical protein
MPHAVGVSGVAYEIGSDVMIEKVELTNFKGFKKFQLDKFFRA